MGLAALVSGCTGSSRLAGTALPARAVPVPPEPSPPAPAPPPPSPLPAPPAAATGRLFEELSHGPTGTRQIALTVDDGDCADCVAGYVDFVARSGIHLTFSPNGIYNHEWAPHATTLRPLIERGQVQIMNHTFTHRDLTRMAPEAVRAELERNDDWVSRTFGITTRPYYRPPFGFHNPTVDGLAASSGFDRVVMWNGSYGDSHLIPPQLLLGLAQRYLQPGVIMIGHANHPTVLGLFDQITALIVERALQPVTLDEMFGTHRSA